MKGEERMSACAVKEEKSQREIRNDEATLRRGGWDGWEGGWMGGTGAGFGGSGSPAKEGPVDRTARSRQTRQTAWAGGGLRGVGG